METAPEQLIRQKALSLGFDLVGITSAEPIDDTQVQYLRRWLASGCAAQMQYMHRNFEKRTNPAALLDGARSVVCVGLNYKPSVDINPQSSTEPTGRVANYALYEDYHKFIKDRLGTLARYIGDLTAPQPCRFKVCTDSAPLAERALASRAGLGFIGRNHSLINPELGCQILLGEIVTTVNLQPDKPAKNGCAECDLCVRACPTGAMDLDGGFDARKCISYLTIEYDGDIPRPIDDKIGNRLFGCDECVLSCPYEIHSPPCSNAQFRLYPQRANLKPAEVLIWGEDDFEKVFAGSAVQRTGLERLKRNAKICLRNAEL